ncbi:Translation initiation factor IF-2 [subsurface metagenome]
MQGAGALRGAGRRKGMMVNINQVVDFDTAATVVADFGYAAEQKKPARPIHRPHKKEGKRGLQARPPVITCAPWARIAVKASCPGVSRKVTLRSCNSA